MVFPAPDNGQNAVTSGSHPRPGVATAAARHHRGRPQGHGPSRRDPGNA